jgi:hypothetical protein
VGRSGATSEALRLFRTAIELDGNFALPYGMAAWCYSHRYANRWMDEPFREAAEVHLDVGGSDHFALFLGLGGNRVGEFLRRT